MSISSLLGIIFAASEILLRFKRRSASGETSAADRSTLTLLWVTIVGSIVAAVLAAKFLLFAHFGQSPLASWIGIAIFAAGLIVRWTAIITLGRFFTVDVTIQQDHRLIRHGLYRWVRHPSYTGMMLAFLGYALTLRNGISVALILVPISLALARRIQVEEAALGGAFGEDYRQYQQSTKRLVPGIY
jgi:protein-S-isoprenylcysteine O-methyltransferase